MAHKTYTVSDNISYSFLITPPSNFSVICVFIIRSSLKTLDLGLKGELTITADMEALGNALYLDSVPESWNNKAYPSLAGLSAWYIIICLCSTNVLRNHTLPSGVCIMKDLGSGIHTIR